MRAIVQYDHLLLKYWICHHKLHYETIPTLVVTDAAVSLHHAKTKMHQRHNNEKHHGLKQFVTWAATAAAVVLPEPPLPRKVTSFGGGPAPPELAMTMRRLRPLLPATAIVCLAETTKDGAICRLWGLPTDWFGIPQGSGSYRRWLLSQWLFIEGKSLPALGTAGDIVVSLLLICSLTHCHYVWYFQKYNRCVWFSG